MRRVRGASLLAVLLALGAGCAFMQRSTEGVFGENIAGRMFGREKCWKCDKRMRSLEALNEHLADHEKEK